MSIGLLVTAAAAADAWAAPRLRCRIDQGGTTRNLEFVPQADPYGVAPIDINGHFLFKAVVVGSESQLDYVSLYVYYQARRQAVLLHEAKYPAPPVQSSPSPVAFTGQNYLYSPGLERELQYGCSLVEVGS